MENHYGDCALSDEARTGFIPSVTQVLSKRLDLVSSYKLSLLMSWQLATACKSRWCKE